ncbi:MAG: hypothetical protein ACRD2U_00235 [Terriglobales bacterium]
MVFASSAHQIYQIFWEMWVTARTGAAILGMTELTNILPNSKAK